MAKARNTCPGRDNQIRRSILQQVPSKVLHREVFMKSSAALAAVLFAFVLSGTIFATTENLDSLAETAILGNEAESEEAIRKLRAGGPAGLNALLTTVAADVDEFRTKGNETEKWRRIAAAIDAVAMQKDAYASGLYWYTDLAEARKAAEAANKPVLTLRLLGNLNEEFSCANSRLFRSLLYSNTEISNYLRQNYILHWKSVRPAPRITIDFGDGRKIERTITGNSIHYVLDDDGTIIEALPGLYSPKGFLIYLTQGQQIHGRITNVGDAAKRRALMRYRKMSFDRISSRREKVFGAS